MKQKIAITLLILFALPLLSCQTKTLKKTTLLIEKSDNTTVPVEVEIADTLETRNHGFMERKNIPDGTGMIFVFQQDQILSFWMKNTPHPLSIAYIDAKGTIRDIFHMTPFSLAPVVSTSSVRYALEVPQGWFEKNNIKIGDKLELKNR